jgi:hypothetical protein
MQTAHNFSIDNSGGSGSKREYRNICAIFILLLSILCLVSVEITSASDQVPQAPLAGKSIPKYVDPLPSFVGASRNRLHGFHGRVHAASCSRRISQDHGLGI